MWWLEQDASCPTCRRFLPSPHEQARAEGGTVAMELLIGVGYGSVWVDVVLFS